MNSDDVDRASNESITEALLPVAVPASGLHLDGLSAREMVQEMRRCVCKRRINIVGGQLIGEARKDACIDYLSGWNGLNRDEGSAFNHEIFV